jgi:general secretion pathway protein H
MKNGRVLIAGFTLLELLVVLAIAGLLASLVPSLMSAALPGTKLKIASRDLATVLRNSRSMAVSQGHKVEIRARDDIDLEAFVAAPHTGSFPSDRFRIRFHPDGSSSGAAITLRQGRLAYTVDVEWLMGNVALSRSLQYAD